ncbi:5-oxoprolinase subunit C family protein [Zobellella maritima]|uniref:5-oxoprolinase subunit C family protein n=1 Tax=Zobellella maritima TaxID=2059725 RepID=UPI000E300535|nr:biotin-dependent carboxyltransferase family protein [Zobellella maritima]
MTQHTHHGYLRVVKPGPLTTLQDAGRFGVRRLGITQGGPADLHAWAWANWLLGNAWGSPTLEITLGGLELKAEQDCTLALCGADLGTTLDGEPVGCWRAFRIRQGQTLRFAMPVSGVRAYLAVKGGFIAEPVLGSVACVTRDGLGGHQGDGRRLAADERLAFVPHGDEPTRRTVPEAERPDYHAPATLGLIPGAQVAAFTGDSLFRAFNSPWTVDTRADRMGVRLLGPTLRCTLESMISEGIALGAVQVPPDGQPIALLNDRQTIGGYPRLGTLTPLACARLAQCPPGHKVLLKATAIEAAQNQYRRFRAGF